MAQAHPTRETMPSKGKQFGKQHRGTNPNEKLNMYEFVWREHLETGLPSFQNYQCVVYGSSSMSTACRIHPKMEGVMIVTANGKRGNKTGLWKTVMARVHPASLWRLKAVALWASSKWSEEFRWTKVIDGYYPSSSSIFKDLSRVLSAFLF